MTVSFTVMHPLALVVVSFYWTPTLLEGCDGANCEVLHTYLNYFVHGGDYLLCLLSFFTSRVPFNFSNAGWLWLFAATYMIWSYIVFALGIGRGWPCEQYPTEECPIYPSLDWHPENLRNTMLFCIAVFLVALPIVAGVYWLLTYIRNKIDTPQKYEPLGS